MPNRNAKKYPLHYLDGGHLAFDPLRAPIVAKIVNAQDALLPVISKAINLAIQHQPKPKNRTRGKR